MKNSNLLITSIIMLTIHVYLIHVYDPPLPLCLLFLIGGITSILNHAHLGRLARDVDRAVMFIGFFIVLYYIKRLPYLNSIVVLACLVSSAMLYFISKLLETFIVEKKTSIIISEFYHILSHITITITNYLLVMSLADTHLQRHADM